MKFILLIIFIVATGVARANPNHLLPIPAYDDDGYSQAVFKSLIGDVRSEIWMVVRPSFKEEYAIVLYQNREYESIIDDGVRSPKLVKAEWVLSKVKAKQKIWAFKEVDERRLILDVKPTDDVERNSIIVSKADYEKIIMAWKAALHTTRYPERKSLGFDGTTYQFYAHYNFFGETNSPTEGVPINIVNLGNALEKIIETKGDRDAELLKANEIAEEIIKSTL